MARFKFLKYVNGFSNRNRRSQRARYYFRRRGIKAIPLPGVPGSEEFMAAYSAALAGVSDEHLEIGANRTLPGTINALIVMYYRSDDWHALADETKKTRHRIIERFRVQHGEKRVALLRREHIMKMLAAIQKPSAKRSWLKTIRGLMRAAVPTMRRDDPTEGIAGIKMPKTKGHPTWSDDEIEQYRAYWPLGTQERLVMGLSPAGHPRGYDLRRRRPLGPGHKRGQEGQIQARISRSHRPLLEGQAERAAPFCMLLRARMLYSDALSLPERLGKTPTSSDQQRSSPTKLLHEAKHENSKIGRLVVSAVAALALLDVIYVGFAHTDTAARVAAFIAGKGERQQRREHIADRQTTAIDAAALRAEEERMAAELRDAEERTRVATETAARTPAPERVASIGPQPDNAATASPNVEERANYVHKVQEARSGPVLRPSGGDTSSVEKALDRFVENAHERGKDKPSALSSRRPLPATSTTGCAARTRSRGKFARLLQNGPRPCGNGQSNVQHRGLNPHPARVVLLRRAAVGQWCRV